MKFRNLYYGVNYRVIHVDDDGNVKRLGWKARLIYALIVVGSALWAEQYKNRHHARQLKAVRLSGHMEGFTEGMEKGLEIGKAHGQVIAQTYENQPWVTGTTLYNEEFEDVPAPVVEMDGEEWDPRTQEYRDHVKAKFLIGNWVLVDGHAVEIEEGEHSVFFYQGMDWSFGSVTECYHWLDHWLVATLGISGQVYIHSIHMDGSVCTERVYTDWDLADTKWTQLMAATRDHEIAF